MSGFLSEAGQAARSAISRVLILAIVAWTAYCFIVYIDYAQNLRTSAAQFAGSEWDGGLFKALDQYGAWIALLIWSLPTSALGVLALLFRPTPN